MLKSKPKTPKMAIAVQQGVVSVGVCVTWLVLCAALVQQSEGALPPLDRDERWRSADVVVNGRVLSIVEQPHESHDNHELGDTLYSAVVHVDDVFQMTRQEPVRRRSNLQVGEERGAYVHRVACHTHLTPRHTTGLLLAACQAPRRLGGSHWTVRAARGWAGVQVFLGTL